ncbi:MAG TPA: NlpC/P60 family protein [Flavobacteriaceae bacterium]|nr:NlpC/P60 family protein [Flavobacteriaceae bacterium]HIP26466.1 NlpC/P60 family protein [Flavobacteriaceae bacterium]
MKKLILILIITSISSSCKSTKNIRSKKQHANTHKRQKTTEKTKIVTKQNFKTNKKALDIIQNANYYIGTKYKFGGTTKQGIDCSGLIYVAYKKENILLPRVSRDMATKGKTISLQKTKKGDLLFFKTSKHYKINHVGLVTKVVNDEVFFIHASTSRGVIISSMHTDYYKKAFVLAKRIL